MDEAGRELVPSGTLAPYCAYLKGVGERRGDDRCRASDWQVAERAFTTLRAAERVCDGGIGQYGVPVTLRFGSIRIPLAVLIVATGPLPGDEGIERASEHYGVSAEILRQMAAESRFWVLHPDKVSCLKETMRHLAEAVSLEVSHAYATAFETVSGLLRQSELRNSERMLANKASELREANLRLEEKHREIHDFTHSVTHDLKKPLGAVKTMLSMLGRGYLGEMPEKQMRAVETASEAAEYMIRLVQDLLESSRLESGAAALSPESIDPNEVVERIVQRFRYKIDEQGIDLSVETLPRIHADVDALEKVFMNLLGNAISYIGDGPEKRISIRSETREERVVLVVEDSGIGIPTESLDAIFEKFRRGSNVADTSGTGLGLAIVKGMVEAHGGKVEVTSQVGEGTTFRLDFPPSPEPEAPATADGSAESSQSDASADVAPAGAAENDLHPPSEGSRYENAAPTAAGVSVAQDRHDSENREA
jgi:signal transduction histidine kinase